MKTIFNVFLVLMLLVPLMSNSQEEMKHRGDVLYDVEVMPQFPGGHDGLIKYISDEVNYPAEAKKNGVAGKVFVCFVVDKDGSVVDAKVERGVDTSLDKEALRVVKNMPKWTPGENEGKKVKVGITLPINFALN